MNKQKKKSLLTVIGLVLWFVFVIVVSYLVLINVVLPGLFGPSEIPEDEKIVQFDDGSVLTRTGGHTYEHELFDNYVLCRSDTRFECYFINKTKDSDSNYKKLTDDVGYFRKYAFDPSGYIAYHYLDNGGPNSVAEDALYEWNNYRIFEDCGVLYDCNTDTTHRFETMQKLYLYCESNDIDFGDWYYPSGYSSLPEEKILELNGWTIASNLNDYSVVKNGDMDLFSGEIDKYFYADRYFAFHFQFVEYGDYDIAENPVIKYTNETIVGKKFKNLLYWFLDVYLDKYIFVDTETGDYSVFDDKKSIEDYADEIGIASDWENIKLD